MKKIKLTQNQFALVDDADFERLNQRKWCACRCSRTKVFYAARADKAEDGKWHNTSMAREILGLKRGDKHQADHINHDTLDNRKVNLRAVTHQQNHFNRKNAKGYHWKELNKKYLAEIGLNGKLIYLGLFSTAKDARNAYLQAKKQYHKI